MAEQITQPIFARSTRNWPARHWREPAWDSTATGCWHASPARCSNSARGTGLNFPHYPAGVRVVAVEPEPSLRAMAEMAAPAAPVPIEVVDARAEQLPFPDGAFDAAVVCLVLCSVGDQAAALAELHRVLRPGGTLRFFEHVLADSPRMRRVQKLLDASIWPRVSGGCHTGRDTAAAITAAGFTITELDRFAFPETRIPFPAATHILGTALRRDS